MRLFTALENLMAAWLRLLAILPLALVLVEFVIVILLYFFAGETIIAEESLRYINALMFLGAAGSVFLRDGHVRVDIFYSGVSPRRRAQIDCAGILVFILPFTFFFFTAAEPLVSLAWASREGSAETGGLPFVYILKTMLYLFPLSLAMAAIVRLVQTVPNTGFIPGGKG